MKKENGQKSYTHILRRNLSYYKIMKIQKEDILTDILYYKFLHPQNWIKGKDEGKVLTKETIKGQALDLLVLPS